MIRISLTYIFGLASALNPLDDLQDQAGKKLVDVILSLYSAEQALRLLLQSSVFSPTLRSSVLLGNQLLELLGKQTGRENWQEETFEQYEALTISHLYSQYKVALLAELEVLPSYFVTQKAGYDTATLLYGGHMIFPSSLGSKVPEAVFDAVEAGKALAYELSTACGFHIFRATEAVLRRYYTQVMGGTPPPKVRGIGVYLNAMRQKKCGDEKILAALKQMADFHRNPVIHPEAALTIDEAISVAGIARSVMDQMLSELPAVLPTTVTSA